MTDKQKKQLFKIIVSAIIFFTIILFEKLNLIPSSFEKYTFILYLIPYLYIGKDVLIKVMKNIGNKKIFDERFLMTVATVAAFFIGEYSEGVAAMLFYQVGELFESYAVNRSRKSIKDLMDIAPEYANVEVDGEIKEISPDDVEVGTTIIIKPGEKIPIDSVVVSGSSSLDVSALTGESAKKTVGVGDEILSGSINCGGVLYAETTKEFEDSAVSKILELVEEASSQKAHVENFITKFSLIYTPVVVIFAVLLAVFSPMLFNLSVSESVRRACIFLVVSCPCALVISVPMSFFGGIGAASRRGILIKGSNFIEVLSKVDTIVFDKTGTLTEGSFRVKNVVPENNRDEILELAAMCEQFSNHPIAVSIKEAYKKEIDASLITDYEELSGYGIKAVINGKTYLAGNKKLMEINNILVDLTSDGGTVVYIAEENKLLGTIVIADAVKDNARESIDELKSLGVKKTIILSGDSEDAVRLAAEETGVDEFYSQLLPADKAEKFDEIIKKSTAKTAFAGDGINDAPVIMRADVGIAMGALGSDAAIEAADIVLMKDDLGKIATAIKISRKTVRIASFNIVFAIGIKLLVLILSAIGIANMWLAIFADVGVSVLAILNAMRTMSIK